MSKHIYARDPRVPASFEPTGQLIVIGLINPLLGGVIGVIFVGLDFFIRYQVLANARLFARPSVPGAPRPAPSWAQAR
jgi:hypothetical protein